MRDTQPVLSTLKVKGTGLPVYRHLIPSEMRGPNSTSKGTLPHKTALISKLDTSLEVSRTISFQTSWLQNQASCDPLGFVNALEQLTEFRKALTLMTV